MSAASSRRARLFLDANVLVSAAWKDESKVRRLWQIPSVELVTSNFVHEESQRNHPLPEQHRRHAQHLRNLRVLVFRTVPTLQS